MKQAANYYFFLSLIPPAAAFFAVYRYADFLFRTQKFPYPFELFGVAAGLGTACWVYAIIILFKRTFMKFQKQSS